MNKKKMIIWGREFNLDVVIKTFSGEEPMETQIKSLEAFDNASVDTVKKDVEKYIIKYNKEELGDNQVNNIFKYVVPKAVYVPWVENKKEIALLCHYRFDQEHDLAILFEDNKLKEIGSSDIVM